MHRRQEGPLHVLYDDQIFERQRRGGVSRYFAEMIREFSADPGLGVRAEPGWRSTRNVHAVGAGLGRPRRRPRGLRGRVLRWTERTLRIRPRPPDLVHRTYYRPEYLSRDPGVPMAVTVYDMTPELFPHLFTQGNPHLEKRAYVERAALVLCISDSTRRDLLRLYGTVAAPTVVTHLGVGDQFSPGAPTPAWCPERYVLFVGNRGPYKDFPVALEAFAAVATRHAGTALLAVGGGRFTADEEALIARWGLRDRVVHHDVSDDELPGAYAGALAFVFPSRYEGFGLPTLEAMACGTPAVLADISSHPEVGGDAALYFPPEDRGALAAQLELLLADDALRRDRSKRSIEQARGFTWRATAVATADAYRSVVRRT